MTVDRVKVPVGLSKAGFVVHPAASSNASSTMHKATAARTAFPRVSDKNGGSVTEYKNSVQNVKCVAKYYWNSYPLFQEDVQIIISPRSAISLAIIFLGAHKNKGDEMRSVRAGIARSSPLFECHNPQKEFDMNIPFKNRLFETSDLL